ncbi:hypothetical protein TNCV_2459761 [Trichonephila clavipes]|nr:hypothetical protein TNCV_2459761 [Trichonephila clavipes]
MGRDRITQKDLVGHMRPTGRRIEFSDENTEQLGQEWRTNGMGTTDDTRHNILGTPSSRCGGEHTPKPVKDTLKSLGSDILPHPLYTPDLVPSEISPLSLNGARARRAAVILKKLTNGWMNGLPQCFSNCGARPPGGVVTPRGGDCFASMSTISQQSHLTFSEAWRVVGWLEGSQTQAEIAQAIGVSQSLISRIRNRFLETLSAGRRPG